GEHDVPFADETVELPHTGRHHEGADVLNAHALRDARHRGGGGHREDRGALCLEDVSNSTHRITSDWPLAHLRDGMPRPPSTLDDGELPCQPRPPRGRVPP